MKLIQFRKAIEKDKKNFIFISPDKTLINHHQHFDKKNFRVDSSDRLLWTDTEP